MPTVCKELMPRRLGSASRSSTQSGLRSADASIRRTLSRTPTPVPVFDGNEPEHRTAGTSPYPASSAGCARRRMRQAYVS